MRIGFNTNLECEHILTHIVLFMNGKIEKLETTPILPRRVDSESLLGAAKALLIVHNGREYQLRLTQNGKLILTA
jgi:hemin uptake protein HemP